MILRYLVGSLIGLLLFVATTPAADPAKPVPTNKTGPAKPAPASPATTTPPVSFSPQEEAERQKILNSREWHEAQHAFREWLSIQQTYPPAEVKKMRVELANKISRMSPRQLQDFLDDSDEKLKVLMSKQAEEARLWVAQRLAVEAHVTPEELKKLRPDVVNMTSAQMEQRLLQLQQQRASVRQTQQEFTQGRQQQIQSIQQAERRQEKQREEALDRAYYDLGNGSPYGYYYGGRSMNNPTVRGGGFYGGYGYRY